MKRTYISCLTLTALLLLSLAGCQLASTGEGDTAQQVGYYLTAASVEDRADETGRIYAQVTGTGPDTVYTFPGLDGVPFYGIPVGEGEDAALVTDHSSAIRDRSLRYEDDPEAFYLEGTLYLSTEVGEYHSYPNPIYQDSQGQVYLTPASGPSAQMDQAGTVLTIENSSTTAGKGAQPTTTDLRLNITAKDPADTVVWCQMSRDHTLLLQMTAAPDQVPVTLVTEPGTDYLLLETYRQGQLLERTLVQRGEETLATDLLQPGGWFDASHTAIQWK